MGRAGPGQGWESWVSEQTGGSFRAHRCNSNPGGGPAKKKKPRKNFVIPPLEMGGGPHPGDYTPGGAGQCFKN